jgi:hypothetical protein
MVWTRYWLWHSSGQPRNSCSAAEKDNDLNLRQQTETLKNIIFRDITPVSPLKFNWRFRGTYCLHLHGRIRLCFPPAFTLVSCSVYSTLKMEVLYSSETSVEFKRTTQRYISEDNTLHNQRCENLKSYKGKIIHIHIIRRYERQPAEGVTTRLKIRNIKLYK